MDTPKPSPRVVRRRAGALVAAAVVIFNVLVVAVPAQATWSPPGYVRSIGGRGEAGVYAWGIQYNPFTNEMLVGDYWNYQIRRYDMSGNEVGAFYRPPTVRKGQPYTISIDPANGAIRAMASLTPTAKEFPRTRAQVQNRPRAP